MLFSGLFKKVIKTESARTVHHTPSTLPNHMSRAHDAALELLDLLNAKMVTRNGGHHAGTMLCAAAWLTGTSLYRSFGFREDSAAGTVVQSNEVNTTWEGLMCLLEQYNFHRADIPIGRLIIAAMAAPEAHKPQVEMLYVQNKFQGAYNAVMKKHGFGYLDGARVGIVLCSMLIQQYSAARIIDAEVAAGLVAEKVLEAAKTAPPALGR